MKLKLFVIAIASVIALVGCQNVEDQEGLNDRNRGTIDQTKNNDNNRMYDQVRNDTNYDRNMSRNNRMNETNQRNVNNRYDISKEAADKVTKEITEIDHAYVITMGDRAYVAAVLDNDKQGTVNNNKSMNQNRNTNSKNMNNQNKSGDELTDEVKKEISDIVQSVDRKIKDVYVTTNPDFADLTTDYVNDMNDGKPVRGFFDQMGNMIERVFPQNKSK